MSKSVVTSSPTQQRIDALLNKLGPAVIHPSSLIELLRAKPDDAEHVLLAFQSDPTLAARVLSVLNSAAFGLRTRITCLQRAVSMLGSARARSIGLAYGLRQMGERTGLPRPTLDTLWANAITKACAARLFCQITQPELAEEAYAAGLIQDIGLPMLMAADPAFYDAQIMNGLKRGSWVDVEQWRFGVDHTQVGRHVLQSWNCSPIVCSMVAMHHRNLTRLPDPVGDAMLYLASFLAGLLPHGYEEPVGWQRNWINAIHARFLTDEFPSPEAFLIHALEESRAICGKRQHSGDLSREAALSQLMAEVGDDMIVTLSHLIRIEHTMEVERKGMRDMRAKAFTDPLTKLLNRRAMAILGTRRLAAAAAAGSGVCVMICDLDDFKNINDTHGHDRGDRMLRALAKLLRRNLRRNDIIARIGGDEFAMVLTDIDAKTAHRLCCNLVEGVEGHDVRLDHALAIPVHFSLGAAFFHTVPPCACLDSLFTAADQALYQRKRTGKRGMSFVELSDVSQIRSANPASHVRTPTRTPPPA